MADSLKCKELVIERVHKCLLCGGQSAASKHLSLDPAKISTTKEHYAKCLFDLEPECYYNVYHPFDPNAEGEPGDLEGKEFRYACCETEACIKRFKTGAGYKDFVIHMAASHDGLDRVMDSLSNNRVSLNLKKLLTNSIPTEEIHDCLLCDEKEGKRLSFDPHRLVGTRYHYSTHLYDLGAFFQVECNSSEATDRESSSDTVY